MQSGFFWKNWSSPYRELYFALLLLLAGSILSLAYFHLQGIEGVLGWSIIAQSEPVQIVMEAFKVGSFNLKTSAESQVFNLKYLGNLPEVNTLSYYLFLITTALCFNILIAIITTLPRFWYFVGTSLLVIALVNLKLELLLLFGQDTKLGVIIALVLYLPLTYVFNAIKSDVPFMKRLLCFLGITAILAVIIFFFSETKSPFFHLATYGFLNAFILSLVFILMIAHQIVASFIYLLTRSSLGAGSGKSSLVHFSVISLIYLINLALAYLHETRVIDWDFLYVDLFLLLGVSAIIGIWSYSNREEQYGALFKFKPIGALFYIALAIICFTTIAHFAATANDPGLEVFRDFIIYSHLGYGLIFVIYVFANFLDPLRRGMQVYRVLYKPMSMPYFTFRLAGLIAFVAFLVKSNWEVPVNQSFSAYYNGLGDLHVSINNKPVAGHYYWEGSIYGYNNHKSNYALAALAHENKEVEKAIERYKIATIKNPSPQSFTNLSSIYADKKEFFNALFTLQEGAEVFPNNGQILNNLGLLYSKTNVLDTAASFIDKATKISDTKATAGSNMLSLLAINDIPVHPDSVIEEYEIEKAPVAINNSLILRNKLGLPSTAGFESKDSTLTYLQASLLYNIAFNHLFQEDSLDTWPLQQYSSLPQNLNHREKLQLVRALNLEKNQDINQAFRQLNWVANSSQLKSGEYFNLLGLWALKYEAPYVAVDYFKWAIDRNVKTAKLNYAIALTETGDFYNAIDLWQKLLLEKDRNVQMIASEILNVLSWEAQMLESDQQRYIFLRYRTSYQDTTLFNQVVDRIESEDYKARAIFEMAKKLWRMDQSEPAIAYFSKLADLKITDADLYEAIQWFELKMLAAEGNIRGLAQKINQGIKFDNEHIIEKHYYTGLLKEASGDTIQAREHYELVAYKNPFFPESVIAAANFVGITDRFEAYHILLSALEINPNSVRLLKTYILQCARIENENYAEHSLGALKELVTREDFKQFEKAYVTLLEKVKEEADNF
ncbi:MAG: hypothetical protein ABJH05_15110 [Fulvivirga sp.]